MMETNQGQLQASVPPNTEPGGKRVKGLGGWMILVQISVFLNLIGVSILLFGQVLPILGSNEFAMVTDSMLRTVIYFETAASIIMFALLIVLVVLMYQKKKLFPKAMITLMILSLVISLLDYSLLQQVEAFAGMEDIKSTKEIARAMISCAVWIPYFMRSKRVKNTFVN